MNDELRAMTKNQCSFDRAVMMSSVMPSAKYSCSASPLIFTNGSTARDGRSEALCSILPAAIANLPGTTRSANSTRCTPGACDVLDRPLSHVLETKAELIAHFIVHDARN